MRTSANTATAATNRMVNTSVLRSVLCLGFKELQPFGGDSSPLLSGHRIDPRCFEQACGIQSLERLHELGQRHLGAEGALLGGEASAVVSVHIVSASIDPFQAQPAPLR